MISRKIAIVFILTFFSKLSYGLILPTLSIYASSLGATHSSVGMIIAAYALVQLFTQAPVGRLSDRFGAKYFVTGGFIGLALSGWLQSVATRPEHLLFLQAFAGLATGCLWPSLLALLAEDAPPAQRGKLMGIFNTIFFIGVGLGPLLGGHIATVFGATIPFKIWAVVSALSGIFYLAMSKNLVSREKRIGAEMVRRPETMTGLVKPGFWPSFAAGLLIRVRSGVCSSFNHSILPLYVVALFDASPKMIGSLMFSHGVMIAFFNLPGGLISDKFGRRLPALIGCGVATAGVIWYSFPTGLWSLIAAVGLAGAGTAFTQPAVAALTADVCNPKRRAEAFAYLLTCHNVGTVMGALAFGFVAEFVGLSEAVVIWGATSLVLSFSSFAIQENRSAEPVTIQHSLQKSAL
ncbi:MAG: MFS transporter [Deltaproteobacteria bacterium]|nr:MFS transporter [Deltaproteobacteria bacterium]